MGQGNSTTSDLVDLDIKTHLGHGIYTPKHDNWFNLTEVKPMSFIVSSDDWKWAMTKNHESLERTKEYYQAMTCQGAIDWYLSVKTVEYCIDLKDKFLMREDVDCLRNKQQNESHCHQDNNGQWVFDDIRDLLFKEEMELIDQVFKQGPALDGDTLTEVPVMDRRTGQAFRDMNGAEVKICTKPLFWQLNCNRARRASHISLGLLFMSNIVLLFPVGSYS